MNRTISPPSKGAGFKLKLMLEVLNVTTIFTNCMKATKLRNVSPKLVSTPP